MPLSKYEDQHQDPSLGSPIIQPVLPNFGCKQTPPLSHPSIMNSGPSHADKVLIHSMSNGRNPHLVDCSLPQDAETPSSNTSDESENADDGQAQNNNISSGGHYNSDRTPLPISPTASGALNLRLLASGALDVLTTDHTRDIAISRARNQYSTERNSRASRNLRTIDPDESPLVTGKRQHIELPASYSIHGHQYFTESTSESQPDTRVGFAIHGTHIHKTPFENGSSRMRGENRDIALSHRPSHWGGMESNLESLKPLMTKLHNEGTKVGGIISKHTLAATPTSLSIATSISPPYPNQCTTGLPPLHPPEPSRQVLLPPLRSIPELRPSDDRPFPRSELRTLSKPFNNESYCSANSTPPLSPDYHPLSKPVISQDDFGILPSQSVKGMPLSGLGMVTKAATLSPSQCPSTPQTTSLGPSVTTTPAAPDTMVVDGASTPTFVCQYPGCSVPPFSTQYLLNSHANVHSSSRPHYCPVVGCVRSISGVGFKRKNEMIRHGLVHESPGYVCPFCPQRDHRYPRPDNLQRHVRVHHPERSKDDELLREVLAQRPEGQNRGRRRRAVLTAK